MRIRKAKIEDSKEISKLMNDTIASVNGKDYNKKQVKVWIAKNTFSKTEEKIKKRKNVFVIIDSSKIIGVGAIDVSEKKITGLYIKHTKQGMGYGKKLLKYLESYVKRKKVDKLKLESTITSFEFYKSQGYKKIRKISNVIEGIRLPCVLMVKKL
jgi:N-acetylglutamate synthase-like GNAT family acetyltransferase